MDHAESHRVQITVERRRVRRRERRLKLKHHWSKGSRRTAGPRRRPRRNWFALDTACVPVLLAPSDVAQGNSPSEVVPSGGAATLPASQAADELGQAVLRVLIADDHRILREGLAGLLRNHPDMLVVGQAADGQEALELARRLRPDVIIMDVTMPRMNGIDATAAILQEMPEIRVIGLSMHEMQDMSQAMLAAGARAYLTKGGPSAELLKAIRG